MENEHKRALAHFLKCRLSKILVNKRKKKSYVIEKKIRACDKNQICFFSYYKSSADADPQN